MNDSDSKISTTAVAKALVIPVQQLFTTLRDYGWIKRAGEAWVLTPKGEFEGGEYRESNRYGRYIVWPEQVREHALLAAIESNQRISAASMRRYFPQLHPRQINRALAELGLQNHSVLGWELTTMGRSLGGQQEESQSSGAFYVTWPHEIIDHPVVQRELERHAQQLSSPLDRATQAGDEPDLFDSAELSGPCTGVDGHILPSQLQLMVCDWLYLAQLAHACQRALPIEELVCADFYVPEGNVYIDCWGIDIEAQQLSAKLHRRELYRSTGLRQIEINASDAERLDEVLGRKLLDFGIRR